MGPVFRVLLTVVASVLYVIGWVAGKTAVVVGWLWSAVVVGWDEAVSKHPTQDQRPDHLRAA